MKVSERSSTCTSRLAARACGVAALAVLSAGPVFAEPLPIGAATYKTHPSVTETPKYSTELPSYISGDSPSIVGMLVSPITGGLTGSITTTVYLNPATNFLTFEYVIRGGTDIVSPIVRATLGGQWLDVEVTDAGANAGGSSGTGDPGAEWSDGDPYFLARMPQDGSPSIQWRSGGLGTAIGSDDVSARIFFETDATNFNQAGAAFLDTAVTGLGQILAPLQAVGIPLPSAGLMGLLGLGVVAQRRRLM